jgi:TolA-binding protein
VLDQYVLHDTTNVRTAEALYFLAKSFQQLGNAEKAKRIADECVERYPKNPIRYQARLISSQARIELDDLEAAEEPLIENLDNDLLTPASMEWRLSLFELSKLLYLEQKWDEAERRLTEAVRRYPEDRLSLEGRYLLAETLRQQAERDRNRSATTAVESLRVGAARSALARLRDAHARTEEALAGLQQLSREVELTPMDLALQRNAAFLRANLLAELARYDEASKAFMEFINRYYGRPETLDAYLALATVFRRMDQEGEARTAVAQAYETLQSLPPDAVMAHTSAGSIADWQNLLTWLQSL